MQDVDSSPGEGTSPTCPGMAKINKLSDNKFLIYIIFKKKKHIAIGASHGACLEITVLVSVFLKNAIG